MRPHLAATATPADPSLPALPDIAFADIAGPALALLVLAAIVWLLGYATACALFPFGKCRRCNGEGRHPRRFALTKSSTWCRRCDTTGLRLRVGRRIWNHLHTLTADQRKRA
ncbi:hypothetical protein Aph01nite_62470 [Acrocarpospora phusangensis]|uniref:Uncharacterized protein n=1 Tax=Acrocarpospora phusangensis TaxID=1070424 RepID=A0A919QFE3_9ACTN|nr:hypothetical protein [Acrocarpospora phusangensis]GIH27937.1 hypothetical protein Aph01nite_62470 [Acrocarpospora phusangensis]